MAKTESDRVFELMAKAGDHEVKVVRRSTGDFLVTSATSGEQYRVQVGGNGVRRCSCPYGMNNTLSTCTHVIAAMLDDLRRRWQTVTLASFGWDQHEVDEVVFVGNGLVFWVKHRMEVEAQGDDDDDWLDDLNDLLFG